MTGDNIESDGLDFIRSRLGQLVRGKYHLDRVLGVGGMGAVYAATHRNRKRFAVKMLHPEYSCVEEIRSRFLREGYVANTVNHPGAVAVLDDDVAEDGSAFLVMELLEGKSFEDLWEANARALPCEGLLLLIDQVLDVLAAAHAQGIVHRDIKPANLFLTDSGSVKVLDFGIARLRDAAGRGVTQTGATLGTPAFMAPEQARGDSHELTAQSDLWAVGATLFVLLTGRLVHEGNNPQQLLINAATRPAPSLGDVASGVPRSVVAVVDRALAFDKLQRWASASEMQRALSRAHLEISGTEASVASPPSEAMQRTQALVASMLPARARVSASSTVHLAKGESAGLAVAQVTAAAQPSTAPPPASRLLLALALLGAFSFVGVLLLAWLVWRGPSQGPAVEASGSSSTLSASGVAPPPPQPSATAESGSAPPPRAVPSHTSSNRRAPSAAIVLPPPVGAGVCARLLERQSLGETLTSAERNTFNQHCREAR